MGIFSIESFPLLSNEEPNKIGFSFYSEIKKCFNVSVWVASLCLACVCESHIVDWLCDDRVLLIADHFDHEDQVAYGVEEAST